MPELPTSLFVEAAKVVVLDNLDYVPPYGTGGALYLRPLLFGSGPRIGLQPADEYTFLLMVLPVGNYYKGGLGVPVHGKLIQDYDRAAPHGVGHVKVAGNYAADLLPNMQAKKEGYSIGLYLDSKSSKYVEEFSTSNFVGIDSVHQKYVTPKFSGSVLPSITNKSLMTIAKEEMGWTVEQRDIPVEELETFDEVLACGTAVVVTPVGSITMRVDDHEGKDREVKEMGTSTSTLKTKEKTFVFGSGTDSVGPTTRYLYDRVRAIQFGEVEDTWGWNYRVY